MEEHLNDLSIAAQRLDTQESSISNHESRINTLEEQDATAAHPQQNVPPPETSELVISGIPKDIDASPRQIASAVLRALDLSQLENDILSNATFPRECALRQRTSTEAPDSQDDPTTPRQNVCTRFVFGNIPWMDHVIPFRQKLGWLPVKAHRKYFLGTLTFALLQTGRPNYLAKNFILTAD
ncbi:hypothetical protein TSAR_012064 [Trichomalopsis sarcophagae]|uniref:Uncharacterized protein n=1 Tax=Trichomalopsis sarcophagae TaxID=543379 RepID=A0A232EL64_9HYME|nr:hypothetical protein TSAR_012064 [Trichomalopsis sarcophagae]